MRQALAVYLLLAAQGLAADWAVVRDSKFEIYSQAGEQPARDALQWFERLRAQVKQETGFDVTGPNPVRVIAFASERDYEPYRMAPVADAYYVGEADRDYIVMPSLSRKSFPTAAHEYAHLIQRVAGGRLPPWLREGLADLLATFQADERGSRMGGDPNGHINLLRHRVWMPLGELMALPAHSPVRENRTASQMFYVQSWALTEMLALAPAYRSRFRTVVAALNREADGPAVLMATYGKSLDAVKRDLSSWVDHLPRPTTLTGATTVSGEITTASLPSDSVKLMMAGLLVAAGDLNKAEAAYRDLPRSANALAGLAALAAARGRYDEAGTLWKRAMEEGLNDADLCYRYAELLDRGGVKLEERRLALERAISLHADFDEARWRLALLENNAGKYEAALHQLKSMQVVSAARTHAYWNAMADTLTELGRSEEAQAAAERASDYAATPEQRAHASRMAERAGTHLGVRMTRDDAGNSQMVTTRVPNADRHFNPFVEPTDDLRRVAGTLTEVECGLPAIRLTVDTPGGALKLTIPDPSRVQSVNAAAEFTCGPQPGNFVVVVYAATKDKEGIVRGLEFP